MAKTNGNTNSKSTEPEEVKKGTATQPEAPQEEDDGLSTLANLADLGNDLNARMDDVLDGKIRAPGENVALNGYFARAKGAQLIGTIIDVQDVASKFPKPGGEVSIDRVVFVKGKARYTEPARRRNGTISVEVGDYTGFFAVRCDAGSTFLGADKNVGKRVYIHVDQLRDLSNGATRWEYKAINVWDRPQSQATSDD